MKRCFWMLIGLAACSQGTLGYIDPGGGPLLDAGPQDAGSGRGYAYVAPPSATVPEALRPERWRQHFTEDLAPYWRMAAAQGMPVGNYPTYRGMDGSAQGSSDRYPRMISRQIYAYSMGYLLTGDAELLNLAKAGVDWLLAHAKDPRGGCHAILTAQGDSKGENAKTTQDTAYCALGLAAYFFVTRDSAVEAEILAIRDLLFDRFWDPEAGRLVDGLSANLSQTYDVEGDNGAELVAQLDPLNGFLLLVQPVLTSAERRDQVLGDLERLAQILIDDFWRDGTFWGVDNKKGQYTTRHADFGHTLKSYWMILEVDKRLPNHPFQAFLDANIHVMVERAYDSVNGRWGKRLVDRITVEYGSDWWIYAEADQLAATLDFADGRYLDWRAQTQANWLSDYVDPTYGEVIPGIRRDGTPVYRWPASDTAKCNQWKNGYHSAEHALVSYLSGAWLTQTPAELYFAVPEGQQEVFVARPYFFHGQVLDRTAQTPIRVGGENLRPVRVRFERLY